MGEIRIQKFLSDCGVCSRRKAESEIENGNVKVNGHPALIGQKIDPSKDIVTFRGERVSSGAEKVYIKLNKPRGYVSTLSDEKGRKCVADLVADLGTRVYPIGRLDLDSEGLLLMTNDGALANALMHPSGEIEKVYTVKVRTIPSEDQLLKLNLSMEIDGYTIRPCRVTVPDPAVPTKLRFVLKEGRNRQIRKMCEQVGLVVTRLKRTAEGEIRLGDVKSGTWAYLDNKELEYLLRYSK